MAITNPFSISVNGNSVGGGSSTKQLSGPYVFDRSYNSFRLVYDVLVTGATSADFAATCLSIENTYSGRLSTGNTVAISLGGGSWSYVVGSTLLKASASVSKSGSVDSDKGFARVYTITVSGEMPTAAGDHGLRDVESLITFSASRQRTVTIRGTYTSNSASDAVANYKNNGDSDSNLYLDVAADGDDVTWELVDESYSVDRELSGGQPAAHLCNFSRQYHEIIFDQTKSEPDSTKIRDHKVTFTDVSSSPGDSKEDIYRLRRVMATYECAVDIKEAPEPSDMKDIWEDDIKDYLRDTFNDEFSPKIYAVEEERYSFDYTLRRISASATFVYQSEDSEDIIEISESVSYRESRTIDYTPVHTPDEFAFEADVGWATLERVWMRVVIVVGEEPPRYRIFEKTTNAGLAGAWTEPVSTVEGPDNTEGTKVNNNGWNVISSTSQVSPSWIGSPDGEDQIQITTLTENVVERFHRSASGSQGGTVATPRG